MGQWNIGEISHYLTEKNNVLKNRSNSSKKGVKADR